MEITFPGISYKKVYPYLDAFGLSLFHYSPDCIR